MLHEIAHRDLLFPLASDRPVDGEHVTTHRQLPTFFRIHGRICEPVGPRGERTPTAPGLRMDRIGGLPRAVAAGGSQ